MGSESWPLWLQWALLILVGGAFLGGAWSLALTRARAAGAETVTWRQRARTVARSFGLGEWATVALLLTMLVPLVIRTIAGT